MKTFIGIWLIQFAVVSMSFTLFLLGEVELKEFLGMLGLSEIYITLIMIGIYLFAT